MRHEIVSVVRKRETLSHFDLHLLLFFQTPHPDSFSTLLNILDDNDEIRERRDASEGNVCFKSLVFGFTYVCNEPFSKYQYSA